MSSLRSRLDAAQIAQEVYDSTLEAIRVTGSISVTPTPGAATEAEQQTQTAILTQIESDTSSIDSKIVTADTSNVTITSSALPTGAATEATLNNILLETNLKVNQTSALIDCSVTPIPNQASLPLQLIASTSARCLKIQIVEDIGEYMALYTGAPGSEVLLCALPLGGGEVEVDVPAATRISIKTLTASPVNLPVSLIINILGA